MTSQVDQSEAVDGSDGDEGRTGNGDGRTGPSAPAGPSGPGDAAKRRAKPIRRLDRVIIRFAGDSGDGMQLTGDRFTSETASFGN
ncbi:2-oxoglutarate ferredoxin oxidoreductase subunit alpha, partial [Kitasatospora sp. NPDC097643]